MVKKKVRSLGVEQRRAIVERGSRELSLNKQCILLGVHKSSLYYESVDRSLEDTELMLHIDEEYTRHPFYGSRRMREYLVGLGYEVNRKRVQRLMRTMGLEAIYPKPNWSKSKKENKKYPYLLKGMTIERVDQVWSTDITYIRIKEGFCYCTAVIDWYSRYVLSWKLSNSLEMTFCIEAVLEALERGKPEIFNTDQGAQYTSIEFTDILEKLGIKISMDGRGRALDNIFVERLWRTLKYENVYLNNYETMREAKEGIKEYFQFYNRERKHQGLGYKHPEEVYMNLRSKD